VSVVVEVDAVRVASDPVFVDSSGLRARWWFGILLVSALLALVCVGAVFVVAADSVHAAGCHTWHSGVHDAVLARCR
jgi:hypothetical protein